MDMWEYIVRQTAKKLGISVAELKKEIQNAVDDAYKNPTDSAKTVPRNQAVPTPEELLDYTLKEQQKNRDFD